MNPIYNTLGGLLCPACLMIGYMILLGAFRSDAAKFTNRWDKDEDEDDDQNS